MKAYISTFFVTLAILIVSNTTFAQFQLNGNASDLGSNTYQLTPATNWQFGAIWNQVQHSLDNPFSLQGQLYFGTISGGADGIVFVMQNKCLVNGGGASGGGIGYGGLAGVSLGVEFDTFRNNGGAPNNNDPAYDHIAIERNGNGDHLNANNLAGPVQIDPGKTSVKDGVWYDFQITYNPATTTLSVYINGALRLSHVYDIKANIFGGNPYIYWGFVSATGGTYNDQRVRISSQPTSAINNVSICSGSSVQQHLPPLSGPNIALGKSATASTTGGGNVANNVTDGNGTTAGGTRWESQHGIDPSWIYIDLVNPSDIDSVILIWENANARQYRIQTSNDLVTWTDRFVEAAGPGGAYSKKIVFSATNVRYVRMYGTQRNTGYGYSLYEFKVYGRQKYLWSPNDGSINDIYSSDPIFSPTVTTTYSVSIPDACLGSVTHSFTVTINCSLPVELIEFKATAVDKSVALTWTTASETNSHLFEILRSFDGIEFTKIGEVKTAGNSHSHQAYKFDDYEFYSGQAYYQLQQTDKDGITQKSSIIDVQRKSVLKPFVVKPVFEEETLLYLPGEPNYIKCRITDMFGKIVHSIENDSPSSSEIIGANLIPGFYMVIVESNTYAESIKINKVR